MRKITLLLAVLLVLGLLVGCNTEKENKEPDYVVPGYDVGLYIGEGWEEIEESDYDMSLTKEGVTMSVMSFVSTDFVDMPTLEELFEDCNDDVLEDLTDVTVVEKAETYTVGEKTIICALYSAKTEEGTTQYYCFGVDFHNEASNIVWVCYEGSAKSIKAQRADIKTSVEAMTSNAEIMTQEELDAILIGEDAEWATEGTPEQEYVPNEE